MLLGFFAAVALGQEPPVNWTAADDHRNMMEQLGIKALRPGPSGKESDPNHANYDESKANPFPDLPDVLKLKNGKKVTEAKVWWSQRRPEIVEDFEREVVGRVPKNVPKVTWTVTETESAMAGLHGVVSRKLTGHVDNSSYPSINVDIQMTLVLPADAAAPVPVMMMFGRGALPRASGHRRRSARDRTAHCRRLGLRLHQSREHSGGQRRRSNQGHNRIGQPGPTPQTG